MTRKRRRQLILELKMFPQEFGEQLNEAGFMRDWKFLSEVSEVVKFLKAGVREFVPFHERVLIAYGKLFLKHGPKGVTLPMIREAVDPKASKQQYSRAFRWYGISFPRGRPRTKKLLPINF